MPWFLVASVTMTTIPFVSLNPKLLPHLANGIQVRQLCEDIRRMRTWEKQNCLCARVCVCAVSYTHLTLPTTTRV